MAIYNLSVLVLVIMMTNMRYMTYITRTNEVSTQTNLTFQNLDEIHPTLSEFETKF